MRTVLLIELPSTKQPMIWARFSVVSRFILTNLLEPSDGTSARGVPASLSMSSRASAKGWRERYTAQESV
jgi:hypothetical protein